MKTIAILAAPLFVASLCQAEVPPFAESNDLRAYSRALSERPPQREGTKKPKADPKAGKVKASKNSARAKFNSGVKKRVARARIGAAVGKNRGAQAGQVKSQARRKFKRNRGLLPPRLGSRINQ